MNSTLCMLARSLCAQKTREIISRFLLIHCLYNTVHSSLFQTWFTWDLIVFFYFTSEHSESPTQGGASRSFLSSVLVLTEAAAVSWTPGPVPWPPASPSTSPNKLCSYSHLSLDRSVWRISIFSSCLLKQAALQGGLSVSPAVPWDSFPLVISFLKR